MNTSESEDQDTREIPNLSKKIAKGGGTVFGGSIVGKIFGFGLHVFLARGLGPASYGLYALGINVIGIVKLIAPLGTTRGIIKYGAAHWGKSDKSKLKGTIFSSVIISLAGSVVFSALLYSFADSVALIIFNESQLTPVLRVFSIGLPFYVLIAIGSAVLQSFQKMTFKVILQNITRPITSLILVGIAFSLGYELYGAIIGIIISIAMSSALGVYFIWRLFPDIFSSIRPSFEVKKLMRFSIPMIFVSLSYFLAIRMDRLMLGILGTSEQVGVYNAAAGIGLRLTLVHSGLISIFMPIISDLHSREKKGKIEYLYNEVVKKWSTYGTLTLILPVLAYPHLIMSIFGGGFERAWLPLIIMPISHIIGSMCGPTGALLQMSGRQNWEFLNGAVLVSLNVLLNFLLIPVLGIIGAATATTVSMITMNVIQVVQIKRFYHFHPFESKHVKLILLAVSSMAIATVGNLFLGAVTKTLVVALIFFLLLFYIYRHRTDEDIAVYRGVMRRIGGKNK